MNPTPALLAVVGLLATSVISATPARADQDRDYDLPAAGVYLEGIGVDQARGYVYVSATNLDGALYRARLGSGELTQWVAPRAGDNGRGVTVDRQGRVYVAGGPSAEVRVFDRHGMLLAELPTGLAGSYPNDVWIGPDGAAYLTDSSLPVIWRVAREASGWQLTSWLDVSTTIPYTPSPADFDLGGIVSTPGGRYLLVSQGTTGRLWRIDLRTKAVAEVPITGDPILNADGLALRGHTLVVVQNFRRQLTVLHLSGDWSRATTRRVISTPSDKTLTTADFARGRLLAVDSQFGFAAPGAEDRVISLKINR